jgi:type I restriction enzyme S subunit
VSDQTQHERAKHILVKWQTKTVGELADTQLGKMLNKGKQTGQYLTPYLRTDNVHWGRFDLSEIKEMDIFPEEEDKYLATSGDLLMCEGGASGRTAIWDEDYNISFQNHIHRIRPKDPSVISPKYLLYYFEWFIKNGFASDLIKGVTISSLSQSGLRSIEVIYPPIDEQHQIVEILEDHLSHLDSALLDVKRAKIKAAQFRRSLLQAGLNGFFNNGPRDESTGFPKTWQLRTLADVADWTSGGTPSSKDPALYGGDTPWIVIGDLTEGVVLETEKNITQKGLDSSSAKKLPAGTVMIAMYGASIGRTGVMGKEMATNQAIACGFPKDEAIVGQYLLYFLQSQKNEFIAAGKGGAQPNISQGVVKSWEIPLPPKDEQLQIINEIESQLEHLTHANKATETLLNESTGLKRSLLQAAFTGQLTKGVASV